MAGVSVAEAVIPGEQPVIPFSMCRSNLGIVSAAPDVVGHPEFTLAPFVDVRQELPREPNCQRREVCLGDGWITDFQDRGSLFPEHRSRRGNLGLDAFGDRIGGNARTRERSRQDGPILCRKLTQPLFECIRNGAVQPRLL